MEVSKKIRLQLAIFCVSILLFRFYLVFLIDKIFEGHRALNIVSEATLNKFLKVFNLLSAVDYIIIITFCLPWLLILVYWFRKHIIAEIFKFILSTQLRVYLFLILLSLLVVAPYFSPGIPYAGDSMGHVFGSWLTSDFLLKKEISLWTNYFWCGFRYLRYYGPLFYYLVGAINLIFHNVLFSLKLTLAIAHILSGIFIFMFLYILTKNKLGSIIGAISYIFTYFHYFQIAAIGRMRSSMFYLILPLLFYYVEAYLQNRYQRYILLFGLSLGSLILIQPGYYSIFTFYFLSFYILTRCLMLSGINFIKRIVLFSKLSMGFIYALVFSAWIWVPMYVSLIDIDLKRMLSWSSFELPAPSLKTLFIWTRIPSPNYYASYIGISVIILSCLGLCYVLWKREKIGIIFGLMCIIAFFFTFGSHTRIYNYIPYIRTPHSAGYYMLFLVFFLSILNCYGAGFILSAFRIDKIKLSLFIIFLILMDLLPFSFQDSYPNKIPHQHDEVFAWLNSQKLKDKQIFTLEDVNFSWLVPMYTGLPVINSPELRIGTPYVQKHYYRYLVKKLKEESKSARLSDFSQKSLYLLNTGYIIGWSKDIPEKSLNKIVNFKEDVWVGELARHSPVVASQEVRVIDKTLSYEEIIASMELNMDKRTCRRIFIRSKSPDSEYYNINEYKELILKLTEHKIENTQIKLRLYTSSDCYLNLSYTYYPDIRVLVDNKSVKQILETSLGSICIYAGQGEHTIIIKPGFLN